jgi:hypothetical protein
MISIPTARRQLAQDTETAYDMEGSWDESRMARAQVEEDGWVLKGEVICPNCAQFVGGYSSVQAPPLNLTILFHR